MVFVPRENLFQKVTIDPRQDLFQQVAGYLETGEGCIESDLDVTAICTMLKGALPNLLSVISTHIPPSVTDYHVDVPSVTVSNGQLQTSLSLSCVYALTRWTPQRININIPIIFENESGRIRLLSLTLPMGTGLIIKIIQAVVGKQINIQEEINKAVDQMRNPFYVEEQLIAGINAGLQKHDISVETGYFAIVGDKLLIKLVKTRPQEIVEPPPPPPSAATVAVPTRPAHAVLATRAFLGAAQASQQANETLETMKIETDLEVKKFATAISPEDIGGGTLRINTELIWETASSKPGDYNPYRVERKDGEQYTPCSITIFLYPNATEADLINLRERLKSEIMIHIKGIAQESYRRSTVGLARYIGTDRGIKECVDFGKDGFAAAVYSSTTDPETIKAGLGRLVRFAKGVEILIDTLDGRNPLSGRPQLLTEYQIACLKGEKRASPGIAKLILMPDAEPLRSSPTANGYVVTIGGGESGQGRGTGILSLPQVIEQAFPKEEPAAKDEAAPLAFIESKKTDGVTAAMAKTDKPAAAFSPALEAISSETVAIAGLSFPHPNRLLQLKSEELGQLMAQLTTCVNNLSRESRYTSNRRQNYLGQEISPLIETDRNPMTPYAYGSSILTTMKECLDQGKPEKKTEFAPKHYAQILYLIENFTVQPAEPHGTDRQRLAPANPTKERVGGTPIEEFYFDGFDNTPNLLPPDLPHTTVSPALDASPIDTATKPPAAPETPNPFLSNPQEIAEMRDYATKLRIALYQRALAGGLLDDQRLASLKAEFEPV